MFISYAQNGEDVWLNRVFEGKNDGFYIDVGAQNHKIGSCSYAFSECGWSGINICLDNSSEERIKKARTKDSTTLYKGSTVGIEAYIDRYVDDISFVRIGEASKAHALIQSTDWEECRPTVLIVKAVSAPMRDIMAEQSNALWHAWEQKLMDAKYVFATFDGLNRYYVRKEDQHLVAKFIIPIGKLADNYMLDSDKDLVRKEGCCHIFEEIYSLNSWGEGSGPGSSPEFVSEYIEFLQRFIKKNNIKTIVDCGCGDWQFSRLLNLSEVKYKGFDVASNVIEKNIKQFSSDNVNFFHYSGDFESLPEADLIIAKDVLQHLPNAYINNFMRILPKYKFAILVNDIDIPPEQSENSDCLVGGWRAVDLRLPPFSLEAKEVLSIQSPHIGGTGYKSVLLITNFNLKRMSRVAAQFQYAIRDTTIPKSIDILTLTSKASTQADIDSPWCSYWTDKLKMDRIYHRKIWEQSYVPQALFNAKMLQKGKSGIVFGCGREPLPALFASMGCSIVATDAPPEIGWKGSTMYADSLENLYFPNIVDRHTFERSVSLQYVDMNNIPNELNGTFDFCWSICALEHLGSLQAGLDFVSNSLKILKQGGVAVHTTEFNYAHEDQTFESAGNSLYLKKHFEKLIKDLRGKGHSVADPSFDVGNDIFDHYVDTPPYLADGFEGGGPHLKLEISGFASTCFGLIITKGK